MKLFFFDTETTWLNPETDRIIQFWAIFWTLDEETWIFHEERIINQYIKIDEEIPEQASNVHHIYKKRPWVVWLHSGLYQGICSLHDQGGLLDWAQCRLWP